MIHIVKQGETIYSIALYYGISPIRLRYDNQVNEAGYLTPGQALLILQPETVHIIRQGETLEDISKQYGVAVRKLVRNNPYLIHQDYLISGEPIVIKYMDEGGAPLKVTGYAYPFIEPYILNEVLFYINELLVFSYGFTAEGNLIPPEADDNWMIQRAWDTGVKPILVLTPFSETGVFNNQLVKLATEDMTVQQNLIDSLYDTVLEKGYAGVDVDFEYILPEDKDGYVAFVNRLHDTFLASGLQVSVALAPKVSSDQKGLLYEGMDYNGLGMAADYVFLMTYEWGYTYGPAMAVAPLNKVRQVLDYAVTEIPVDKIIMGVPNYGYDWTLPFVRGESKARLIGNVEAVNIAVNNGVPIQFDEIAQSPFYRYRSMGEEHEVWFEDVRSIEQKIQTVKEYGFQGFGYWNLMRTFRANWLLVNQMTEE